MNIGYKKLRGGYIAELEILGKTNENRDDIADSQYAKYRTSKAKVLKIFHTNDETRVIKQVNGLRDENFMYGVGKEIYVADYDENVNAVCSKGIHYFKTLEQAKMWELNLDNYAGKLIAWHDDGTIQCEGKYKDRKFEGKWFGWYEDGNKRCEDEYKDGKLEGKCIGWYESGTIQYEGEYKDGKQEGKWIGWYEDGTIQYEREYKNGKEKGKSISFVFLTFVLIGSLRLAG